MYTHMENISNKKNNSFCPSSSSSFESLLITDDVVELGSTNFFPKYPSSFYRRKMMVGPRSPRFFLSDEDEGGHHFLDTCHLCKRPIGGGRDIFMYRGDTPFCSEECRQEQIEMDEADEKRAKLSKKTHNKRTKTPPALPRSMCGLRVQSLRVEARIRHR